MLSFKKFLFLILLISFNTQCKIESEESCKQSATQAFRDFCVTGLVTAPLLDPEEPRYDLILQNCLRFSYEYNQCNSKKRF